MTDWISVIKLSKIQGITPRAVRKSIANNKYVTRTVKYLKGFKYEIYIPSLDEETQNLINFEKQKNQIEKKREPVLRKFPKIPTHAKQIALSRYDLVNLWVDYKNHNKQNKTQAGKDFINLYNEGKMYPVLFNILGKVSVGTIYRWSKELKNSKDYEKLIPKYDYGQKECSSKLTPSEETVFKSLLLSANQINIQKATKLTKYILKKKGIESPTCERNFRRYADNFRNTHYDEWIFAREGQKALQDKVLRYIERDISQLEVGDVLVADGHRLAVQCINPFSGKACRATLIGYLDWKSTMLVGYEIMLEEDTQAISSALRNSIINLGKIPKICYQDNGKAFRAKFFTGDLYESGINGLFEKLGIIPVFAKPYNAKAKPIERFFREFQEGFEKLLPSYVGSNIFNKPAYLKRNEKIHKENHIEFIPTIEQLKQMIEIYLEFYRNQICCHQKDKTIGEVFDCGKGEGVNIAALDELMLQQEIKKIGRNGIRFLKADYYNDELYGKKGRVIVKYSLSDLRKIRVYSLNNEFICEAERVIPIHPMAEYLGDVEDKEKLKFVLKQKKQLEKQTIKEIKTYFKSENMQPVDWQNPPTTNYSLSEIPANTEITAVNETKDFKYDHERYEWHLKNGFSNDSEVAWFKAYELSDEYKLLFGKEKNERNIC